MYENINININKLEQNYSFKILKATSLTTHYIQ